MLSSNTRPIWRATRSASAFHRRSPPTSRALTLICWRSKPQRHYWGSGKEDGLTSATIKLYHAVPGVRDALAVRMDSSFKTRPNTYSLGLAPSSRAKCRACKRAVGKGEVRVVTHAFIRPGRCTYFVRHASCATVAFVASMLRSHSSIERVPVDSSMDAETATAARALLGELSQSTRLS